MSNREQCSRRWIGDATSQRRVSEQFSTPGKKYHASVDDPTRTQRKEGEHGRTKKKKQRDESEELFKSQGTDDRRMLVVE